MITTENINSVTADRYRVGVPPVFPESQPKYLQDELTKIERVLDLTFDNTVTFHVDNVETKAAITHEQTIRADADEAIAKDVLTLSATLNSIATSNAALVVEEKTARVTADTALAQTITTLTATVTGNATANAASLTDERTARANADSALSQEILTLKATTNATNASLTAEQSARANADSALAQDILTLKASTNSTSASLTAEQSARATADSSIAQRAEDISAYFGNVTNNLNASIQNETSARATADSAIAQSVSNLSSTVGNNTATINQVSQTVNGIAARWGIRINNNGRMAGIQLNSGAGGTSSVDIEADGFNIYKPNSGERTLYWDGATLVVRGNILATSITTDAIAQTINGVPAQSISRPVVGNPTIVAQGTYSGFRGNGGVVFVGDGAEGGDGKYVALTFTQFIPTGIYVGNDWTVASTNQYLATATISSGYQAGPGHIGYSEVSVVVGDGIGSNTAQAIDNQIYIKYVFNSNPSDTSAGTFNANAINWKLARL